MRNYPIKHTSKLLTFALMAVGLFYLANQFRLPPHTRIALQPAPQMVIAAPIQLLMYAGDSHLAANIESIRISTLGGSESPVFAQYRVRSYDLISLLNPCHEDNLYLSNAMLSWGGSVDTANTILERATECRYWDYIPPFFLSFNRYFFKRDIDGAIHAMDMAAMRNEENRSALRKASIVMASEKFNDEKIAVEYLQNERDRTTDPKMAKMLDRRLKRLHGLLTLRNAQTRYEKVKGHPLRDPNDLISSGFLDTYPEDPTRIGYELVDGEFQLRGIRINGVEIR